MRRKQTYLIHKTYARCRILAARYSSNGKELFLVEANPGTEQATQHQLLIGEDGQWWSEFPEVLADTFETFLKDSDRIEKALALKAKKAAEAEAANVTNQADAIPDSEPDVKPIEIRRRERELDLSDFDPDGFNVVEEDSDDARDSLGLVMP